MFRYTNFSNKIYINLNKNAKIHKNEVQEIRWSGEYWQIDRVAGNIKEYQIISKLIP